MNKDLSIFIVGLVISWLTCWYLFIPISIIALSICIYKLYKLYKRKSKWTKFLILCSPFVLLPMLNVGFGINDYVQGNAIIKDLAQPNIQFSNLDTRYRVRHSAEGPFTGIQYFTVFRYNQTVKYLINTFGYQKGSYLGVFPTENESNDLINGENVQKGTVEVSNKNEIKIISELVNCLINIDEQHILVQRTIRNSKIFKSPDITLIKNDCLVCQLNEKWVYVIDLSNNMIIAQYRRKKKEGILPFYLD